MQRSTECCAADPGSILFGGSGGDQIEEVRAFWFAPVKQPVSLPAAVV